MNQSPEYETPRVWNKRSLHSYAFVGMRSGLGWGEGRTVRVVEAVESNVSSDAETGLWLCRWVFEPPLNLGYFFVDQIENH